MKGIYLSVLKYVGNILLVIICQGCGWDVHAGSSIVDTDSIVFMIDERAFGAGMHKVHGIVLVPWNDNAKFSTIVDRVVMLI